MPDALSKTIPIWCAVWNRVLFPEQTMHHNLQTDKRCVSESEHRRIEARLDHFVALAQVRRAPDIASVETDHA